MVLPAWWSADVIINTAVAEAIPVHMLQRTSSITGRMNHRQSGGKAVFNKEKVHGFRCAPF